MSARIGVLAIIGGMRSGHENQERYNIVHAIKPGGGKIDSSDMGCRREDHTLGLFNSKLPPFSPFLFSPLHFSFFHAFFLVIGQ